MTRLSHALLFLISLTPLTVSAQAVDKNMLLHPPSDSWPSFFGDYSARRFSALKEINNANVQDLSLEWATRFTPGTAGTAVSIKSPALLVNGILYFTSPNNGWAADARTGRELWHYGYPPNTGNTNGNRGFGIYGNWLYMENTGWQPGLPLNAADGKRALEGSHHRREARLHHHRRAHRHRQPHPSSASAGTTSIIPASSNRSIPKRAQPSGRPTPLRVKANPALKPGPTNTPPLTPPDKPSDPRLGYDPDLNLYSSSAPATPIQ